MSLAAPIYPVQVASIADTWPGPVHTETTPGSGYTNIYGHTPDRSSGNVTLADTSYTSWTAPAQLWWDGNPNNLREDEGITVARFPARPDAPKWLGYYIEVGYQGIAPTFFSGSLQQPVTNQGGVFRGDWANRLTGAFFNPPYAPTYSSSYVPDAATWSVFRSVLVQIFPTGRDTTSWLAGTFAIKFGQVAGLARPLPGPEYPYKIAFVRIIPELSVRPPLRQRQRSDGLAASGAPRQHQRSTLQTSNRQRAVR